VIIFCDFRYLNIVKNKDNQITIVSQTLIIVINAKKEKAKGKKRKIICD
jgi:hypothetical protein